MISQNEFMDMVELIPFHTCWEWIGSKDVYGYGRIYRAPRTIKAHRLSYQLFKGPLDHRLFILHSCDNPGCVNPEHLRLGTQKDNVTDMIKRGRNTRTKAFSERSHCNKGHELTDDNVYFRPDGRDKARGCKKCKSIAMKNYHARHAK